MSSRRLMFTCGVVVAALAGGTWQAMSAFPLLAAQTVSSTEPGPLEKRAVPITPENPIPRRINYEAPVYPEQARVADAQGSITLVITLDEVGRVAEARRTQIWMKAANPPVTIFRLKNASDELQNLISRGPEPEIVRDIVTAFSDAAVRAVQQWRYESPAAGPISFPVTVSFSGQAEGTTVQGGMTTGRGGMGVTTRGTNPGSSPTTADGALRVGGNIKPPTKLVDVRPVYPPVALSARVSGIVILEALVGADGAVQEATVLRSIPLLDAAAIEAVRQWRFTPTLLNGQPVPVIMTVTVNFTPQGQEVVGAAPAPRASRPTTAPRVIREVKPVYSADMMAARVEGTVEVEVMIDPSGKVSDARVLRGAPALDKAAVTAARQWVFTPSPGPITTTIEFSFTLRGSGKGV